MTAIVGVLCQDGVVIGTDSSTTFAAGNQRTIEQPTKKLHIIRDTIIIAGTGQVGLGQRFNHVIEKALDERVFTGNHIDVGRELCKRARDNFAYTGVQLNCYGALVAFLLNQKAYLCEFASTDLQPEFKDERIWYCSMGSGQLITDPFLGLMREVFWAAGPPKVQDATFAVTWALDHAVSVNPGGVNKPVRIAVMERDEKGKLRARILDEGDLAEHRQHIEEAKRRLRTLRNAEQPSASVPDVPDAPSA